MAKTLKHEASPETMAPASTTADLDEVRAELARARPLARAWASNIPEANRPEHAGAFSMLALLSYAVVVAPDMLVGTGTVDFRVSLDDAAAELARSIGRTAGKLPQLEALHHITSLYAALLPEQYRGAAGAFYTPPCLAARLLDQAEQAGLDWATAKVLDPAAGGGVFLVHAATRMLRAIGDCEPRLALRHVANRLRGLELDLQAAALAQVSIEIVLAEALKAAGESAPKFIEVCDTLSKPAEAIYDLVVGNPPYGRVTLSEEARQRYSRSLYGHANLYGVFTDAALRWTKKGGLIAYLTPTSFLAGQYYSALRSLLAKEAPPVAIDFVHARKGVFEDVLQETLLAVYRKGSTSQRTQIHHLTVSNEVTIEVVQNGTVGLPKQAALPWLAPRSPEHSGLIAQAEVMPHRLADWGYTVSTGPLVWNRFKDQLRQRSGGRGVHPLIWAEAVTPDGQFVFRAEKKNHAPYFKLNVKDRWLLVEEACVLIQRTTSKEQARRLIAAEMPAEFLQKHEGVVVENHLNMVRGVSPKVNPCVVAALMNSEVLDQLFRCMNGSVAVSAFELEALPLPHHEMLAKLSQLVEQRAAFTEIEAECRRLYGLDK
ncbi:RNA methyltransferase [Caulobacter vibrioides]|nr:RNA methyltransferase [Caulobacter vibrioides]